MRNWLSNVAALTLILGPNSSATAAQRCTPVAGAEQFAANKQYRFIIVGEVHGTNETPALVGDLACELSASKPVTVALEFNVAATPVLDSYLHSDGGEKAKAALLALGIWHSSFTDGRSSKAMFALIERLRELRSGGANIRIVGFQPNDITRPDPHYYELAMARNWAKIADDVPNDLVLILVGNLHAMKQLPARFPYAPAASHLKASETVSLGPEPEGGSAWNCQMDGCHAHALSGVAIKPRQVGRFTSEANGYDGSYSVGTRYSASEPFLSDDQPSH